MGVLDAILPSRRAAVEADRAAKVAEASDTARVAEANADLLQERIAELELAIDDAGWLRVDMYGTGEFSHDARRALRALCRLYALKNPLVRRRVRVQTAYVFGQGVEIVARDGEVNEALQSFLDDHRNRAVLTSAASLQRRERDLQTDGDLFLTLFINRLDGSVVVRKLPADEVTDIVTNPEDAAEPRWYLRSFTITSAESGTETRRVAYIDHHYALELRGEDADFNETVMWKGQEYTVAMDADRRAVPVIHVKVGEVGDMRFGVPEVYAMIDWAKSYKTWLEDWASISRSLARFAWRLSTTGKAAAAAEKLGTRLGTDVATDAKPAPVVGSAFVQQPGTSLDPIRTSGVQPRADDGLQLRKMAASASDFADTILGADPDMGNLATAKTLDRPTELTMRMRQDLWGSLLTDVAMWVVMSAIEWGEVAGTVEVDRGNVHAELPPGEEGEERSTTVDVRFPPILERDALPVIQAASAASTFLPPRTIAEVMLDALGIDDQDEILGALFADPEDPLGIGSQPAAPPADGAAPPEDGAEPSPPEAAAEAAIVRQAGELREALERIGRG